MEREARRKDLLMTLGKGLEEFKAKDLTVTALVKEYFRLGKLNRYEFEIIKDQVERFPRSRELVEQYKRLVERI
jgi:hypothetical protein